MITIIDMILLVKSLLNFNIILAKKSPLQELSVGEGLKPSPTLGDRHACPLRYIKYALYI